ncbi:hypothetical protein FEM48_Zijuj09G0186000 [Ziziphus jujuba var. spinosa]|uniref:Uncharacterized protein n=1 Tax=Ziziphus jujuba var. spinosa TaxID=714518 RepID=A0A978UUM5_ZIZJJ|nr:hypothetical protein FEM48_Zijuj09G0186000 [Ziziphus jujuba var. spinosa]
MKPDQQQDDETQNREIPNGSKPPPPPPPSSSSSSPPRKKTRDLPTLSECHACKFRIDIADGKSKLHTLYSEWRIVLLCKKCFAGVESSEICSYCFGSVSEEDRCFTCSECNRRVHRDCFSEYKTFASRSHSSCLGSEKLSVCMDCWIPRPLASWRGVVLSDRNGKRKRRNGGSESGIPLSDNGVLEDVVKDANSMVEKKIEAAAEARERAATKAAVAKKAIEFATNALGFVAKIDEREGSVDDSQLAFELHRAINGSSRRISKNLCSVNLACLAAPKGCWEFDGGGGGDDQFIRASCSANGSVCGRPDSCSYGETFEENRDKNVSEALDLSLKEGEGSCSMKTINLGGDDNGSMDFESLSFCKEEEESIEQNSKRCDAKKPDCNLFKYYQRRRKKNDRYFLKYRRKKADRYFFKYSKRKTRLKAIPPQASA